MCQERQGGRRSVFIPQQNVLPLYTLFNTDVNLFRLPYGFLCICKEDEREESKRINHAFSPHTCVGENKSPDIRVFSLTRGLGTICGLLLRL